MRISKKWLKGLKKGDTVIRMLAGMIPQEMKVTKATKDKIICDAWTFNRDNGWEIDKDLGWDGKTGVTGSFIVEKE